MSVSAYVLVNAEPARIDALGTEIADLEHVREVHSVAGSGIALVARLVVSSHEDVSDVVVGGISGLDGVIDTQTLIAFRSYSTAEQDHF